MKIVQNIDATREPRCPYYNQLLLDYWLLFRFADTTLLVSSKLSSPVCLDVYTSQSLATGTGQ